jgi:phage/plasmid-like protein (TIGR03299 family)
MAHNLNIKADGTASVMVVGESAWHKLGTNVSEAQNAEQAIKMGGLDFLVEKRSLFADGVEKPLRSVATVRQDTNAVLGIVGRNYQIVQNHEAFGFFDSIVDTTDAIFHTAGVLGDGERIWVQAKMPEYIKVGKDDLTEVFVTLTNNHDGWGALKAYVTPIRVVCENTLRASLANNKGVVSLRHTINVQDRLKEAHKLLDITNLYSKQMEGIFNGMAKSNLSNVDVDSFLAWAFPSDALTQDEVHTRTKNNRLALLETIETGVGQKEAKMGTKWWLYNGYTRFLEDKGIANKHYEVQELLDGSIHTARQSAFQHILSM